MTAAEDRCLWTLDRIDPYIDGDLATEEVAEIERHLADCPECRQELALARAVTSELRSLPELECPQRVVDNAAARVESVDSGFTVRKLLDWFGGRGVPRLRPAMAVMVLVIAAASVFVLSRHEQSPFNPDARDAAVELTDEEIELAKVDAMLAFAYLGRYSRRTGEIIKKDVLEERVIKPIGRTIAEPIYPFPRHE
jgi:anti-sigma factor RsiW